VNGELNVLSAVLTYAREIKVPCASPKIRRFKTRKSSKGKVKVYSRDEVGFILAASAIVAPRFTVVAKFLFETGCRKSEAINLPWTRVDLDRGLAKIWNEVDEDDETEGSRDDGAPSYTVKSVEREVPLTDDLAIALRKQKLKVGTSEWVFPVTTHRMGTKGGKYSEFPDATWARVFAKATELARAKDPTARNITGGPHRCRHTYASHYLKAKPDLFALGRLLGHSHVRVTEIHGHLLPGHLDEARNVVSFQQAVIGTGAETRSRPTSEEPVPKRV
jgi:integrase